MTTLLKSFQNDITVVKLNKPEKMEFLASTAFPFHHAKHLQYVLLSLKLLPHHYVQLDSSRLTALYFIVISLDMLKGIDSPSVSREQLIEFIYMHQLSPSNDKEIIENGYFGFVGGTFLGVDQKTEETGENSDSSSSMLLRSHRCGHLAMIYTAIMTLLTLNDNLSRIDRISIGKGSLVIAFVMSFSFFLLSLLFFLRSIIVSLGLQSLQQSDGSFLAYHGESENDLRFVYCACATASILNLWRYLSKPLIMQFIISCQTYEGGFGLQPEGSEAQGGATYCAIASLMLMEELETAMTIERRRSLIHWCQQRCYPSFPLCICIFCFFPRSCSLLSCCSSYSYLLLLFHLQVGFWLSRTSK
jgi:geranylgeranyl transferase type-1 subunit beta